MTTTKRTFRHPLFAFALALIGAAASPAQNLIVNGEFDIDTQPWEDTPPFGELVWNEVDHSGCGAASGSAQGTNLVDGAASVNFSYCLEEVSAGTDYSVGAYLRIPTGQVESGGLAMNLSWMGGVGCTGTLLGQVQALPGVNSADAGEWIRSEDDDFTAPAGTESALLRVALSKSAAGDSFVGRFDGLWLVPRSGYIYSDDFETASLCRWSPELP